MGYLSFSDPERIKLVKHSRTIQENEHAVRSAWITCVVASLVKVNQVLYILIDFVWVKISLLNQNIIYLRILKNL